VTERLRTSTPPSRAGQRHCQLGPGSRLQVVGRASVLRIAFRKPGLRRRRRHVHHGLLQLVRRPDAARHRLRPWHELPAPARGIPLHRHPHQGDHPEPDVRRRRLRRPRAAVPGRLVQGLHGDTPECHRGVGAGDDLHDPVRALNGLPRVHPDPGQGSSRPRPRVHGRRGQGDHHHGRHRHQRRRDHGLRVRRLLHDPAGDHAGARHRPGSGDPGGRDRRP